MTSQLHMCLNCSQTTTSSIYNTLHLLHILLLILRVCIVSSTWPAPPLYASRKKHHTNYCVAYDRSCSLLQACGRIPPGFVLWLLPIPSGTGHLLHPVFELVLEVCRNAPVCFSHTHHTRLVHSSGCGIVHPALANSDKTRTNLMVSVANSDNPCINSMDSCENFRTPRTHPMDLNSNSENPYPFPMDCWCVPIRIVCCCTVLAAAVVLVATSFTKGLGCRTAIILAATSSTKRLGCRTAVVLAATSFTKGLGCGTAVIFGATSSTKTLGCGTHIIAVVVVIVHRAL